MQKEKLNIIKKELAFLDKPDLIKICLRLAKHKTENKELLSFLIFNENNTESYIEDVKTLISESFKTLPRQFYALIKGLRKLLRIVNKHLKFLAAKEHEAAILLFFCKKLIEYNFHKSRQKSLALICYRQLKRLEKAVLALHEDLQFDFEQELIAIRGYISEP